jgi:hypothetical protein
MRHVSETKFVACFRFLQPIGSTTHTRFTLKCDVLNLTTDYFVLGYNYVTSLWPSKSNMAGLRCFCVYKRRTFVISLQKLMVREYIILHTYIFGVLETESEKSVTGLHS